MSKIKEFFDKEFFKSPTWSVIVLVTRIILAVHFVRMSIVNIMNDSYFLGAFEFMLGCFWFYSSYDYYKNHYFKTKEL